MKNNDMNPRTREMLRMRLAGKSHDEIGREFGVSGQRVVQILKPFKVTKGYTLNGADKAQDSPKTGVEGILDKIVLKVKKFV